jgi:transglutaminase-like putative cysteine protease
MFFEIEHITRYRYTVPVTLGDHLLRFTPRQDAHQRLLGSRLEIDPVPVFREEGVDRWGNGILRVAFDGETDHLEIRAYLEVETLQPPLISQAGGFNLPPDYGMESVSLAPYLQPLEEPDRLNEFLQPLLQSSRYEPQSFLFALNRAINRFYHSGVRLEGHPHTPAETLTLGEGVCRDLAVLFMAACRQMGLAARFVSGYQQGEGVRMVRYLHAWPEVYLPGLGWQGYDPTHAELVSSEHVAVAAAPDAVSVTPVEGGYSFIGGEVTSTLDTDIHITTY